MATNAHVNNANRRRRCASMIRGCLAVMINVILWRKVLERYKDSNERNKNSPVFSKRANALNIYHTVAETNARKKVIHNRQLSFL